MFFLKCLLLCAKIIFVWLLINHSNLSDLSYSVIRFAESFDINSYETILPCHRENLPFIDPEHGHILTGDVPIIQNNKLKKLIARGTKYRETSTVPGSRLNHQLWME